MPGRAAAVVDLGIAVVALFALVSSLALAAPARAEPVACQRAVLKASLKLVEARSKLLGKCEDRRLRGALPPATDCGTEPATADKVARAESKLATTLARACGGPDRTCGTPDDEPPATSGWPATCPGFAGADCWDAVGDCDDVTTCLLCVDRAATERTIATGYPAAPDPDPTVLACQRVLGEQTRKLAAARANALRKCWDLRLKGRHTNPCPDPGDGKAAARIAKAESKARAKICKACGGADRACGGGDDLAPSAIGLNPFCAGAAPCIQPLDDFDAVVECATCVTALDAECTSALAVPALTPYPADCPPAEGPPWDGPRLELDGTAAPVGLDLGWTGFAHDFAGPWLGRLTLALSCPGGGVPPAGECTLLGPLPNDGGPAYASRRCADRTWLACASDVECLTQGAEGPCRFFLGPPQPVGSAGDVPTCSLNAIVAPVSGTLNVATGALAATVTLRTRLYFPQQSEIADPCPRCNGGVCHGGARAGLPCVAQGFSDVFGDAVSLDCPPLGTWAGEHDATIPLATEHQAMTLSVPGSPTCLAGFSGSLCLCDTCATAAAEACHTDADCSGSAAGSCGGRRCLGGAASGTPCTMPGLDPVCGGAPCGTVGQPTRPNDCANAVCTPVGGGAGICAGGPFRGACGPSEPFRGCDTHTDCPVPGDVCAYAGMDCFPDNGVAGMGITAAGVADPPIGGAFAPTLGAVFCLPPTRSNWFDTARGLPGPGRVTTTVSATIVDP